MQKEEVGMNRGAEGGWEGQKTRKECLPEGSVLAISHQGELILFYLNIQPTDEDHSHYKKIVFVCF